MSDEGRDRVVEAVMPLKKYKDVPEPQFVWHGEVGEDGWRQAAEHWHAQFVGLRALVLGVSEVLEELEDTRGVRADQVATYECVGRRVTGCEAGDEREWDLSLCGVCGSVVADEDIHSEWHRDVSVRGDGGRR